jgi:hypothetical protein
MSEAEGWSRSRTGGELTLFALSSTWTTATPSSQSTSFDLLHERRQARRGGGPQVAELLDHLVDMLFSSGARCRPFVAQAEQTPSPPVEDTDGRRAAAMTQRSGPSHVASAAAVSHGVPPALGSSAPLRAQQHSLAGRRECRCQRGSGSEVETSHRDPGRAVRRTTVDFNDWGPTWRGCARSTGGLPSNL